MVEKKSIGCGELSHINCEWSGWQPTVEGSIFALAVYQLDKVIVS